MIVKKIGIIGSGVVGSATGKGFHRLGHDVLFYDIAKQRLLTLKEEGYQIASSVKDIIDITNSLRRIDRRHEQQQHPHLIVFRSTMLPGTMRSVVINYLQTNCPSSSITRDYDVCYNPEFLRQNTAFDDFFRPDRVVIGEDRKGASQPLKEIYQQLTENIIVTSFEAAEMIKYTSNCFLSLKISFFNEIGLVCKQMGIDDKAVSLGVSMDKRIGNYGTQFGKPFEGACLPKDTEALAGFIKNLQLNPDLLQVALDINRKMEELTSSKPPVQRN